MTATDHGRVAGRHTSTMAVALLVRLLGPLDVERAGIAVSVGSPKQRRLLAELAMAEGQTVSTDRLLAALWGEHPPVSARNSLQTYVARLRDLLTVEDVIVTRPGGYALNLEVVDLDHRRFADAVTAARGLVGDEPAEAMEVLVTALAAWRGDPHAEFDDDVARGDARRLAELRAEARELLATARARAGDLAGALDDLDRLVADDPLRETAVLARAHLLARRGRVPDALAALQAHRERLADELGLDPSAAVANLETRLLRGEVEPAAMDTSGPATPVPAGVLPRRGPSAPPRLGTPTVGRDGDLARIDAALQASRVVTLVGPGGVGKTRLATEVAGSWDQVAWIDLASVQAAGDVLPPLADGLGARLPTGADPSETVIHAMAAFPGLVVVDTCEQVLDQVADLVDLVLARPGDVHVLATSRERLDVAGELVVTVAPLPVPAPDHASEDDAAVRLFVDRLVAAGGAPVSPREAAAVAAAVDGLPLAIELAAARAVALPVTAIVERLQERLDVLDSPRRRRDDRHRTLTNVIAWSHDLLAPADKVLFRRLAVFTETFRLEDVERICTDGDLPVEHVPGSLARLVEQSMVIVVGPGRYRLLDPLRLFATDLLARSGDHATASLRQREATFELAALADEAMTGPEEVTVASEVDWALPDLRAVVARAVEADDLETVALLAGRLYRYAYLRCRVDLLAWGGAVEGRDDVDLPPGVRARALAAAAAGAWMSGDPTRAAVLVRQAAALPADPWSAVTVTEVHADTALALGELDDALEGFRANHARATSVGHAGLIAQAEAGVAFALLQRGDVSEARWRADAAVEQAAAAGARSAGSLAHYTRGDVLAGTDPDEALCEYERGRALGEATGARFFEGLCRTAEVALRGRHGDPDVALEQYAEALRLWRDAGAEGLVLTTLRNLVVLLVRVGADAAATTVHTATEQHASRPSYGDEHRRMLDALAVARERLGASAASAVEAGAAVADLREASGIALAAILDVQRSRGAGVAAQ